MIRKILNFLIINFGLFLVSIGIYLFEAPNRFTSGGVSGLSIIIANYLPGIPVGIMMLAFNLFLIILSFIIIGKKFTYNTIYSGLALPLMVCLMSLINPVKVPLTDDMFLELFISAILFASGSAIVFNRNSSTGGTDIIAKILTKITHINIGKTLLATDLAITVFGTAVYGIKAGLYSMFGVFIKGVLVDILIDSAFISKHFTIISNRHEDIRRFIIEDLDRDATVYKAKGAYTGQDKEVLSVILSRRQAVKLKNYIKAADRKAFMFITNTSEIIGEGFRHIDE